VRRGAGTEVGLQRRDLVRQALIAIECTIQLLLLPGHHVAELDDGALQVREFFFDGVEAGNGTFLILLSKSFVDCESCSAARL